MRSAAAARPHSEAARGRDPRPVFCSTVIPTVGRPTLERAVRSVLQQTVHDADYEVIVVNDSGSPLRDEAWMREPRVRIIQTPREERSRARNAGAAVAHGAYLHFLDDDDELMPGALQRFWSLSVERPSAVWLSGGWQTVDNSGRLVAEFSPSPAENFFSHTVAGESVPLQASLLKTTAFRQIGGYDPGLVGVEDRDLSRRIALIGVIASVREVVSRIRIGQVGSTTNWSTIAELDRQGREKALDLPGALSRMKRSVDSEVFRGRAARAYFASASWNARRSRYLKAISRLGQGLVMGGRHWCVPDFWRGLATRNP